MLFLPRLVIICAIGNGNLVLIQFTLVSVLVWLPSHDRFAPIDGWDVLTSSGTWSYRSMKVRPQQLNSIFEPQVSGHNCSVAYDQLLCNVNFQVYAVQNLDRNGLPY